LPTGKEGIKSWRSFPRTTQLQIEFAFSAEEFENAIAAAYNKRKKNISVPGFRKGKAPRKVIEAQYGEGVFFEDAVNSLYNQNIAAVVEKSGLDVVDVENTEVVDVNKETGVKFKADLITKPVVEISDYKGLEVKKTTKNVDDAAVDAEIEKVRNRNARSTSVEDRAAQNGDTAVIDFEGFLDGVAFEGGKGEKFPLELGSGSFIPGFEDQIVGKSIGEEFDVNVTFPEHYQAENLAGKPAVFKCKLHELKGKELPDVDDEFVKDVSEFDTLDEYKADIKSKLEKAAADEASTNLDNALVDAVISKMTAEVPQVMYQRRIDDIVREWSARNRIRVEDYLKYTGATMDQFRANFTEVAKRQVDLRLALEKIAELENIIVSDEDLEKEYADMAEQYKMDVEKVKAAVPAEAVKNDLRIEKALDLVRDSAKIEEVTE
jgi:trigger factor